MANTVNFTGAVERDLLRRAKVVAAKTDTSVNALFNAQLRYLVETFEHAESGQNANYATLVAFSLGKLDGPAAMHALGVDNDEDLFVLMAQARLPMPRLPEAQTASMVAALHAVQSELDASHP
jgi:hypothetical protein